MDRNPPRQSGQPAP